jgi:hypothetical protein
MTKNPALEDMEVLIIFNYMTGQVAKLHKNDEALAKKLFEVTSTLKHGGN